MSYCYGRLPQKSNPNRLYHADYATSLAAPPKSVNWVSNKITDWRMVGNDRLGDCVIAAKFHEIMSWQMDASGTLYSIPDSVVEAQYFAITGGRDSGCNLEDVLHVWATTGLFGGDKIAGAVSVNVKDFVALEQAIYLGGCLDIGISVMSQFEQVPAGGVWSATSGRSIGGHGICILGYDSIAKMFSIVSWGKLFKMTYDCFAYCCDEAYMPLGMDWVTRIGNKAPNGFNLTQLKADLAALGTAV